MEKEIDFYLDRIMEEVNYWIKRLDLTEKSGFKVNESNLNKLKNNIKGILENLFEDGKLYLLTKDYCYFLVYTSLRVVDYQKKLLEGLKELAKADYDKLIKIEEEYMRFVIISSEYRNFDKKENYVNRMDDDVKAAYYTCENSMTKMYSTFVRGYESDILLKILFHIYGYCFINNKLDIFDKLVNKYFIDPRQTIDHFVANGFLKDLDLIDDFDNYILDDMQKENVNKVIK